MGRDRGLNGCRDCGFDVTLISEIGLITSVSFGESQRGPLGDHLGFLREIEACSPKCREGHLGFLRGIAVCKPSAGCLATSVYLWNRSVCTSWVVHLGFYKESQRGPPEFPLGVQLSPICAM